MNNWYTEAHAKRFLSYYTQLTATAPIPTGTFSSQSIGFLFGLTQRSRHFETVVVFFFAHEFKGDFTGEDETLLAATEEDIAIVCGSCTTVESEGDANPASKLVIGFMTSTCAGLVAVGSAFGSWF